MAPETIQHSGEAEVNDPTSVVLASVAEAGQDGVYHLLNDARTGSFCGQLQDDDFFAGNPEEIVPRQEAENRGLQPCHQCMTYTGER